TNTTRPSPSRPTPSPPAATPVTVTSSLGSTSMAKRVAYRATVRCGTPRFAPAEEPVQTAGPVGTSHPNRRLVLASASPARLRLLTGAGFEPEVIVSGVDEKEFEAATLSALVAALAQAKAEAGAGRPGAAGAVIVACDSLLDVDGEAHGKPAGEAEARARLQRLRGRSAILRTGHCVIDTATGRRATGAAATEVVFARFTDAELDAYLATGEPLHVAGAFTLDRRP